MDLIWNLEINITVFLQGLGSWLAFPMKGLSFLGTEEFYLFIMPALYWCIHSRSGLKIGLMLLISGGINAVLKVAFHMPRPYWYTTEVKAYAVETSFGMPSGHSQNAASLWGLAAIMGKRKWMVVCAFLIIFLIGLSRIYLGVHFTSDVIVGWLIGGLILFIFIRLEKPVSTWLGHQDLTHLLILCFLTSFAILFIGAGVNIIASQSIIPADWIANAQAANGQPFNPFDSQGYLTLAGTWLGLTGGASWLERRLGSFQTEGSVRQKILRYGIGLAGLVILAFGLGAIFPRDPNIVGYGFRFLRYTLIGLWISALAPLLFYSIHLARPQKPDIISSFRLQ